ncbi:MAG TPA: hypothetical protein VFG73_02240 [Rhodanobacteraceae bacterium]|nr:hypothetical protein [Rhodanobacteraceae bacterium]
MPELIEITSQRLRDDLGGLGGGPSSDISEHPLDRESGRALLAQLEQFWAEARDAHADNRYQQLLDADYYDNEPWRTDDARVLEERGQAPLAFPLIKQVCDWIIGTERRTRIDWDVKPRKEEDVQPAHVKKELLKYVADVNGSGFERSRAFEDVVKVGVGWTEECYNNDRFEEPVTHRYQNWKAMWWDPYSTDDTLKDCRYLTRAKWTDADYAVAMFPDRADVLKARTTSTLDPVAELLELEANVPQMFYDRPAMTVNAAGTLSIYGAQACRGHRPRVLLLETWFKKAVGVKLMLGDEGWDGERFDPADPDKVAAVESGTVSLVDSVSEEIWVALWTPGSLLKVMRSPYKHNRYPFTPSWGYRRHRDGMPYGTVRPTRDAADEYNKRRSKILFDLSTNRVKFTSDACEEGWEDRNLEEAKRPDGEIRLKPGHMEDFQVETHTGVAAGEMNMLAEAKANIYEASGVTRENTGTSRGDQSGRAILAKQQQGSVNTAALFDNYRRAIKESGQKTLSNCEQFLTLPKVVRVVGPDGALQWIAINQPHIDPATGEVVFHNDITASEADFEVDQADYRETVRMAMAEQLFEMIGRMPPEAGLQLLDIAVDLTDIPNKAELAKRLRALNGQTAPGSEDTPEVIAARQQAAAAKQRTEQLDEAERMAKVRKDDTAADVNAAKAKQIAVGGKRDALDTAGLLAAALPLAPAADRLYQGDQPPNQP